MTVEAGHGRIDLIRELGTGRREVEVIWIIARLTPPQANVARGLEWVRQYWSIETGTPCRLDVGAAEDRCRVRHPVAATVPGQLRRAVMAKARNREY